MANNNLTTLSFGFGQVDPKHQKLVHTKIEEKTATISEIGILILSCSILVSSLGIIIANPVIITAGSILFFLTSTCLVSAFVLRIIQLNHESPPNLSKSYEIDSGLSTLFNDQSVITTNNARESTEWKLELLRSAEQSIELSGNFCGGKIFDEALEVIETSMKSKKELKVRLLLSHDFLSHQNRETLNRLSEEFKQFEFLITDRKWLFYPHIHTIENHVKLLVVDEKYYMVGGTGLVDNANSLGNGEDEDFSDKNSQMSFSSKFWRDTDIIGKGNAAKTLRHQFNGLFNKWKIRMGKENSVQNKYKPIDSDKKVAEIEKFDISCSKNGDEKASIKIVIGSPDSSENKITEEYIRLIKNSKSGESIRIENLFFSPPSKLISAMVDAVKRGVKFEIITNGPHSKGSFDAYLYASAFRLNFSSLFEHAEEGQVKIYEYRAKHSLMHKKVMQIGNNTTVIGSFNLGYKSHYSDDEIVLVVDSEKVANKTSNDFKIDVTYSELITKKCSQSYQMIRKIWASVINNSLAHLLI